MIALAPSTREGLRYRSPTRHHGQYGAVIEVIARRLGKKPSTIRDYISGHHQLGPLVAAIVSGLKAAGQDARAEAMLTHIRAATKGITHPQLTTTLLLEERTADGDQDVSLVRFLREPTAANRRALIHDLDIEITIKTELRSALAAECEQ